MEVIIIANGLGNQMSQYAFFAAKKNISPATRFLYTDICNNKHNGYELYKLFNIRSSENPTQKALLLLFKLLNHDHESRPLRPFVTRILNALRITLINENDEYDFNASFLEKRKGITFYLGGWHSEKYFFKNKHIIRENFTFKREEIGPENESILNEISGCNSVAVHIRRGDFLHPKNYAKHGTICTINYFQKAIDLMKEKTRDPHFFIFSNDMAWAQSHLKGKEFSFIDINHKENSWKDMFLMSNCKHNICSNSTFSWWSAWLNQNIGKVVIVPKFFIAGKYFEDIYPENWIKLEKY